MTTQEIIKMLRDIIAGYRTIDGIPADELTVAADKLEELEKTKKNLTSALCNSNAQQLEQAIHERDNYAQQLKVALYQRDEALVELETRKESLLDAVEQIEGLRILRDRWYERANGYEKERDEARAEVAQLRDTVAAYEQATGNQQLTTRPEPSRLEIAAMAMQGFVASSGFIIDIPKTALQYADALIKAEKNS